MLDTLIGFEVLETAGAALAGLLSAVMPYVLVFAGFSVVIFFHELGHFLAAKWCDVRVDKFAIGFGRELFGFDRGETRYSFNALPLGGYVKMLGQEDFAIDKSGELMVRDDPRAFIHKSVGQRIIVVSAGVIMNFVFAAVLFMIVFMIGKDSPPAVVGSVIKPESPAERVGLLPGDRIVSVDRQDITDFTDLGAAVRLSAPDEPMEIVVERRDPADGTVRRLRMEVEAEHNEDRNLLELGVAPALTNVVSDVRDDPALPPDKQLQVGDEILEVDGQPVSDFAQVWSGLQQRKGEFAELKVRRTRADGTVQTVQARRRVYRSFRPTGDPNREGGHLLGLVPRRRVTLVNPGERADLAGLKPGDIIVRWGEQEAPLLAEILDSIPKSSERDIRVEVLRQTAGGGWQLVRLVVRPRPKGLFGRGKPMVGMSPSGQEEVLPVVADICPEVTKGLATPAARLRGVMPRGALITKVNDRAVASWAEVVARFREAAGGDVRLTWRHGEGPEQSGVIHVPQTIGTTFDLPPDHYVTKIDGKSDIVVDRDGRLRQLSPASWVGASEMLRQCVGRTVAVEHRALLGGKAQVEQVAVTAEMADTWVMRLSFELDDMVTGIHLVKVRELNPLKAMMIGVRKTWYFIDQVYLMMRRMVITRSVGFEQVSGPVGIVKIGSDVAERDPVELLYFLALISANLAVINFLPLPIVDGGLFVFLIVEKIKGSPIPLKVQVATQIIGLALIIGVFLYVTLNDIQRIVGH